MIRDVIKFYVLQSFGTDELFIESKSIGRLFSRSSSQREDSEPQHVIAHQHSLQNQASRGGEGPVNSKKEEEWDKEIPPVSIGRVIALNSKEWWIILLGLIGAALNGLIYPAFAFLFGEVLAVFAMPSGQILSSIGLWAGLFLVLGTVSGIGVFLKVSSSFVCVCDTIHLVYYAV